MNQDFARVQNHPFSEKAKRKDTLQVVYRIQGWRYCFFCVKQQTNQNNQPVQGTGPYLPQGINLDNNETVPYVREIQNMGHE